MKRYPERMLLVPIALVLVLAGIAVTEHSVKAQAPDPTNLLFNFVTNQAGFDTLLEIANTTQDPYGTTAVSGRCTLNFFGVNAPAAFTTAVIPAGTVRGLKASTIAPNFQGYIIATCQFPLAHGWYSLRKPGTSEISGSQAQVLPSPRNNPESLNQ